MVKLFKITSTLTLASFILALSVLAMPEQNAKALKCIKLMDFYDSGFFDINPDESITKVHNLGGDPGSYLVFVYGKNNFGIHQARYGSVEAWGSWIGLEWWELDDFSITVHRSVDDLSSGSLGRWEQVGILILKVDLDEDCYGTKCIPLHSYYDSGWFSIDADEEITKVHDLSGNSANYLVFLYGRNSYGIHNANYGTTEKYTFPSSKWYGAAWLELNDYSITIRRAKDDNDSIVPEKKRWNEARIIIIRVL